MKISKRQLFKLFEVLNFTLHADLLPPIWRVHTANLLDEITNQQSDTPVTLIDDKHDSSVIMGKFNRKESH